MKTWKYFFKRALLFLSVLLFTGKSLAASEQIPNGGLEVAYRQLENGKLSESVHNLILACADGECELTTLTLNQCGDFYEGKSFYPKIETSSTRAGNLIIRTIGIGAIEIEEKKSATFKYRFNYTTKTNPSLSKLIGSRTDLYFNKLINFSGAAVKQSDILNKVISWELVPLKGESVIIKPACSIYLKGVPK